MAIYDKLDEIRSVSATRVSCKLVDDCRWLLIKEWNVGWHGIVENHT